MKKLYLFIVIILMISGCSFNEIDPLPQDYHF